MTYQDYKIRNKKTDIADISGRYREIIVRVMSDGTGFGWQRYQDTKQPVSDSQFDISGTINVNNAVGELKKRFNASSVYYA